MIAAVPSATLLGVDGRPVVVEVHVMKALPGFNVVGLPDAACREAQDRVRAALSSSGIVWPNQRITVNLAPVGVRKGGSGLDLPIAIGLLVAAGELPEGCAAGFGFLGELGLDGSLRPVRGVVPMVAAMACDRVVVPCASAAEATVVNRHPVCSASSLVELLTCLKGEQPWPDPPPSYSAPTLPGPDLAEVRGQPLGRLAVEVSAAGGHHLLLCGPPGAGKSMLAKRLPGLLPPLEGDDAFVATSIHSAAGLPLPADGLVVRPPLRAPHHGASAVSLIGGGSGFMRPGELSMAHGGVLLLDEMAEFSPVVLDALRQPLEEGVVRVCRARASAEFPARVLLVGTTNPCPCGQGGPAGRCRCSVASRARYLRRLSGPLLDRFDLRVLVGRSDVAALTGSEGGETTAVVAERVAAARHRARLRGVRCNAELSARRLDEIGALTASAGRLLEHQIRSGALSGRGLHRVRRVALTLADLAGREAPLGEEQVGLALALRVEVIDPDATR